jgi:hypothetical protein
MVSFEQADLHAPKKALSWITCPNHSLLFHKLLKDDITKYI